LDASLVERGVIGGRWIPWFALLLPARFPVRVIGEIGADFANRVFDHRAAVGKGHAWKALGKVPAGPGMGMGCRFYRAGFSPAEQFMGRNEAFAQLQVFFAVIDHALGELLGMRQKEVNVESAHGSQHRCRRIQGGSFLVIGSSLVSPAQVKGQFRSARGLAHPVVLLLRTNVLGASSVLRVDLVVKLVRSSDVGWWGVFSFFVSS
jgi:hypothetical protein